MGPGSQSLLSKPVINAHEPTTPGGPPDSHLCITFHWKISFVDTEELRRSARMSVKGKGLFRGAQ